MKILKFTIAALLIFSSATLLNANNSEKISKMTRDLVIEPSQACGTISLDMFFKDANNIAEITIERGTILGESFRQIKSISAGELQTMVDGKLTIIDKYPLAGNSDDVYYRAVVIDKEGVMRFFPASQMVGLSTAAAE